MTFISSGCYSQSIRLNGSSRSFFQIKDLTSLGISNKEFSISLWIRPFSFQRILIYVSSNESDDGWSLPFLAFSRNGSVLAQIYNSNGILSIFNWKYPLLISQWSYLVQTFSTTNGLRLYINDNLIQSENDLTNTYIASGMSNFITLANRLNSQRTSDQNQIDMSKFYSGDIDDFRVYSRELSSDDIHTLYFKWEFNN